MNIRKFQNSDLPHIDRWIQKRGLNLKTEPAKHSYIIPGVCFGQLLLVENGTCIIDNLVSNKYVSLETRNKAINQLIDYLIDIAKELGLKRIIAFSENVSTLKRAVLKQFTIQPHLIISKDI